MSHLNRRRFRPAQNGRELAWQALCRCESEQAYGTKLLSSLLERSALEPRERRQASALFYGCLSRRFGLDACLSRHSSRPLERLDPLLLQALRLAAYQIYFSPQVPHSAAVNSSVELLKRSGHRGLAAFANATLRALLRAGETFPAEGPESISLHPELYASIQSFLRAAPLEAEADGLNAYWDSLNRGLPLYVRLRGPAADEEALRASLAAQGALLQPAPWTGPRAAILELGEHALTELAAWRAGHIIVQGIGAQLPAYLAARRQPRKVLDLCAAPGGKCLQLRDALGEGSSITACDLHAHRLEQLRANAERLNIRGLRLLQRDATEPLPAAERGAYDLVLADVPCSSLGLLARKAEMRLHPLACDDALLALQQRILCRAGEALAAGGLLIYSTCTFNPAENQGQIKRFLLSEAGRSFALEALADLPPELAENAFTRAQLRATPGLLNLYPQLHGCEGFFIAQLRKAEAGKARAAAKGGRQ